MEKHRAGRWLAIVAAVALVAAGCGGGDGGGDGGSEASPTLSKTPIKIGNVGTYSGFAGVTSKASAAAVEAWAKQTNADGGINGHPVEVIVKDDEGDAAKSIAAVKDLVENEKVIAIVGQHSAGLEASWASYVGEKKIPVIGGNGVGAVWMSDPNFFPTALNSKNYITFTANTTQVADKKKFSIVFCAEAPACGQAVKLAQAASGQLGIGFAGGQALSASAPNYTAQCLALRKDDADTVFIGTSQETGLRFVSDCAKQGFRPTFVQGGQSWTEEQLKNKATDGMWLASDSALWFGDGPGVQKFEQAMKKYAPDSPLNGSATGGWTGAVVFGEAAANISETPTAADIYKGLHGLGADYNANGLIPPVTYSPDKPAAQKPCGWYAQVKGGELTTPQGTEQICVGG